MNSRQIDVLITLLDQKDFISASRLSKELQVSTKTIYSDLKILDQLLLSKNLTLIKVPRHGIYIEGEQSQKTRLLVELQQQYDKDNVYRDYQDREMIYLKQFILEGDSQRVLDLSVSLYLSETSVRRDLEKLEEALSSFNLYLSKKQGVMTLEGCEQDIRYFYRSHLLSKVGADVTTDQFESCLAALFGLDLVIRVREAINNISSLFSFSIPSHLEIYLLLDLLIARSRITKNHYIENIDNSIEEDLRQLEVYPFAGELLSRTLQLPVDCLPHNDIKQICLTILSLSYVPLHYHNKEFQLLTEQLIAKVSDLSGIHFREDKDLQKKIENHIRPMFYRLKNGIHLESQTTEEIKKRYSILFNIVWLASKDLSDIYHITFGDAEIAFLTIYFQIAVEKIAKPLIIYVVCQHGLATSELIISTLKRLISPYDYLKSIDLKQFNSQKAKEADMIVSSVDLGPLYSSYILVSPILTHHDIEAVRKQYESLVDGNRNTLSVINDHNYVNQSLVKKLIGNRVYLEKDLSQMRDCICYLVDKGGTENDRDRLLEAILSRERLGSTSVYTGIALPHAAPETVDHSYLSLLTLKNPIRWGANKVQVVMLIAIKEGEEAFYKDALIYIYSKIDNQDFIRKLAEATDKEHFIRVLLGEES
ncbi:BglG family transcription antiterminator [Streptococcus pluranimalium]|uniref:BglG family transcription antiterminator n=1 Tax=Streptococcus pluranimalium TaxID=82348 RepID=UPI003F68E143